MTSVNNARFCFNNWLDNGALTASSSLSGYPTANLIYPIRSKLWKAEGAFEISAANGKVYIDAATYTVAPGTYNVAGLIAAFNTATGKTLSRNALGRFIITSETSCTLKLSTTSQAIWDVLGYLSTSDQVGTSFTADERRYSTGEWIKVDMGLPQTPDFAALIPAANTVFSGNLASIKLQGNNLDTWVSPPVNVAMSVSDEGAFVAPDDLQPCRFWRIFIDDKDNNALSAAVAYIGTAVQPQNTNIATGFTRSRLDQSVRLYSEAGALYVDRRPKVLSLSSIGVQFLRADDLLEMEQLFYDLGVEKPFFLVIDPKTQVSTSLPQMTHYVACTSELQLSHVIRDYYNLSVELREVL